MISAAYLPASSTVLFGTVGTLAAVVLAGFAVPRLRGVVSARIAAWGLVIATTAGLHMGLAHQPAGFRMLAIIGGTLFAMKAVVTVESRRGHAPMLDFANWVAFAVGWFGMRPRLFAARRRTALPDGVKLVRRGLVRLVLGAALVLGARAIHRATGERMAATLVILPGLSLMLHFGLFSVAAGLWRLRGVPANELFRAPLASRSLDEFWSRRWNVGFSEMTSLAVFRPVRRALGGRSAVAASFLFSGLLHELAISVPVRAGYGWPSAYFALHAVAMIAERPLQARGRLQGNAGRAWTLLWVLLPTPILFHPAFLEGVIRPLLG